MLLFLLMLRRTPRATRTANLLPSPALFRAGQAVGGAEHLGGGGAGLRGALVHAADVGGDVRGAGGGLLHVAGDLVGRRVLLFDRRGDGRGVLVEDRKSTRLNSSH